MDEIQPVIPDVPKMPAIQLYVGDWLRDSVSGCGLEAQGLWLRLILLMHDSTEYGVLLLNGKPMTAAYAARKIGATPEQYAQLMAELEAAGVPGKRSDGAVFSRRMVKDHARRLQNIADGMKGAAHGMKGKDFGKLGGRPGTPKPPAKPAPAPVIKPREGGVIETGGETPQKPPPSSSSSIAVAPSKKDPPESGREQPAGGPKFFIDHFFKTLETKLGEKPVIAGGEAAGLFAKLMKSFTPEEIVRRIDNWVASTDPFIVKQLTNIGVLYTHFNTLKNGPILAKVGGFNGARGGAGYAEPVSGKYKN